MSEAIKCFGFLVEHVPSWIKTVESLEQKVRERQLEISRIPVPTHKLKKTGSNESIRPTGESEDGIGPSAAEDFVSAPQARHVTEAPTSQQLLAANRKRKTTSVLSNTSGPSKYRSRNMIVVYYDSEIQNSFEQLVRNIGTGRNQIRKARMVSRMDLLTSASGSDLLSLEGARREYASIAMFRTARGPGPRPNALADVDNSPADAFGQTDAALEKAQSLCERGAHQFLRDGDCDAETAGAMTSFKEVLAMSEKELERLKTEESQRLSEREEQERARLTTLAVEGAEIAAGHGIIEADDDTSVEDDPILDLEQFRQMTRARRNGPYT